MGSGFGEQADRQAGEGHVVVIGNVTEGTHGLESLDSTFMTMLTSVCVGKSGRQTRGHCWVVSDRGAL